MLAAIAASVSACAFDPHRERRPARFLLGANTRDLGGNSQPAIAAREAMPTPTEPTALGAATGVGQFTMAYRNLLAGFELEAGRLEARGSNFAGAYGVLGAEHATRSGSIGVELVSGWRGVRAGSGVDDVNSIVVEPRVRGQYRIGDQVSLGGVLGATLGERGSWMLGVNVGFYSSVFGE